MTYREIKTNRIVIFFHQVGQSGIQLLTQRTIFFILGKLTDNESGEFFKHTAQFQIVHHALNRMGTFTDIFEKQDGSFGRNIIRSAAQPVSYRHISATQDTFGRTLPVQFMLFASINGQITEENIFQIGHARVFFRLHAQMTRHQRMQGGISILLK